MQDYIKGYNRPYVVIAISGTFTSFLNFEINPKQCVDVLKLKFDDILVQVGRAQLFTPYHANAILDFFKKYKNNVPTLICHCEAGISRSAAVCAALLKVDGLDNSHIFNSDRYLPNTLVYDTILKTANIVDNTIRQKPSPLISPIIF